MYMYIYIYIYIFNHRHRNLKAIEEHTQNMCPCFSAE